MDGYVDEDDLVTWGTRSKQAWKLKQETSYSLFDQIELEICSGTFTIKIKVCFVGGVTLIFNAAPRTNFVYKEK